jgi:drug/metabolite transporter (DMT)-like permease
LGDWVKFWILGLIWGSSFLLIRISIRELNPFELVFIRTTIAAVGLNLVLALRGKHLPLTWKKLYPLILLGLGNTALPFMLLTWGEKHVDSGLAAVLQSTLALFSFLIAHRFTTDERINAQKFVGLVIGFIGVVVLSSRSWAGGQIVTNDLLAHLAIVLAALCYAIFTVYCRRELFDVDPVTISAGAMTFAAIATGILTFAGPALGQPAPVPLSALSPDVLFSAIFLGFVNTLIAYFLYYALVQSMGAARTSMITYVEPPIALALGAFFLGEILDARLLIGTVLIFVSIGIVNARLNLRRRQLTPVPETD